MAIHNNCIIEHDKRNCGIGGVQETKTLSDNQRIDKQFK